MSSVCRELLAAAAGPGSRGAAGCSVLPSPQAVPPLQAGHNNPTHMRERIVL